MEPLQIELPHHASLLVQLPKAYKNYLIKVEGGKAPT